MAGIKCDSCDRKQLVKVNVLRKSVNQLRDTRQRFPGDGVNLFRMDHDCHKSQITVIKTETETETVRLKLILMKSDLLLCIYNKFSTSIFSL